MKSVIIIGAGIAGLSAGCYARMNGYEADIFELHSLPGGLCTSWKRNGYTFDGCIHWLVGTSPKSSFHRIWSELGALNGKRIVDHDEFYRIEGPDGRNLVMYTDPDRLEQHLKELSPTDEKQIEELVRAIRQAPKLNAPIDQPAGLAGRVRTIQSVLPAVGVFARYGRVTVTDLAARFSDPLIRQAIVALGYPDFPAVAMIMTLGFMAGRCAGYPVGGSLEVARSIERRYIGLGGRLHYRSRVSQILVEDNRAVGIRLADGTEHRADVVISAADGHATLFDMLHGAYVTDELRKCYDAWPIFPPIIQVSLGVNREMSNEPSMLYYPLHRPIVIAGSEQKSFGVKNYCYDPTLTPPGKSALVVVFASNHDFWKTLAENPAAYQEEKRRILEQVLSGLEERFPGISAQVEVSDVATPLTYERYTGNWQGSMEGWMITTANMGKSLKKTLPGLEDFYMIGQWTEPGGGLPPAAKSGRDAVKMICEKDGKMFRTEMA